MWQASLVPDERNASTFVPHLDDRAAIEKAKAAGLGKSHVSALKAGIEVLKRKRLGRLYDWNPKQSFAAIGITTSDDAPERRSARTDMSATESAM